MEILESTEYALEVLDSFSDGFKAFRRQATQAFPKIDFSGFVFDDNSSLLAKLEVVKVEEEDVSKGPGDGDTAP